MKFIPNSSIKQEMLNKIGFENIDDLFSDIPNKIRIKKLNLPTGLSQQETEQQLKKIADKNKSCSKHLNFLGGGIKQHYIPAIVKSITSRSEFLTAYTPYQSEASQGFLKAMFEYQSIIANITKMDIANCSLYDGATALGEAALMATRIKRKKTFLIPDNISWEKKSVLGNYIKGAGVQIKEIEFDQKKGTMDIDSLKKQINNDVSAVYIENPNFYGIFEDDIFHISDIVKNNNSLFIVNIDPLSLGIIKSPGDYNSDIVIGEGRALGNPMDFGGSSLGIFACKKDYLRQIPGRLISMTNDANKKQSFCMAMQTREQHIRRAKATSNICTNEGLCALSALVYLSWLGSNGLNELSFSNFKQGKKLSNEICKINGFTKYFTGTHFNEFVIKSEFDCIKINDKLLSKNIQGGLILNKYNSNLDKSFLFGVTEMHSDEDINQFINVLKDVSNV
jgi:glycine dehydrogenase subunit 1